MSKWYCYRNHKTGEEVKKYNDFMTTQLLVEGFELIKVYDLSVSDKERKAK